jgi:hypothetical protein
MQFQRIGRILGGSVLAAALVLASSPAIATASTADTATMASSGVPAAPSVRLDPTPGYPWVFYIRTFGSEGACSATGRAFVNSKQWSAYTCRYAGGRWRLYLYPPIGTCFSPQQATTDGHTTGASC